MNSNLYKESRESIRSRDDSVEDDDESSPQNSRSSLSPQIKLHKAEMNKGDQSFMKRSQSDLEIQIVLESLKCKG